MFDTYQLEKVVMNGKNIIIKVGKCKQGIILIVYRILNHLILCFSVDYWNIFENYIWLFHSKNYQKYNFTLLNNETTFLSFSPCGT
jgi:hypothetical protein